MLCGRYGFGVEGSLNCSGMAIQAMLQKKAFSLKKLSMNTREITAAMGEPIQFKCRLSACLKEYIMCFGNIILKKCVHDLKIHFFVITMALNINAVKHLSCGINLAQRDHDAIHYTNC